MQKRHASHERERGNEAWARHEEMHTLVTTRHTAMMLNCWSVRTASNCAPRQLAFLIDEDAVEALSCIVQLEAKVSYIVGVHLDP